MEKWNVVAPKYRFGVLFFFVAVIGVFTHGAEIFNAVHFFDDLYLNGAGTTYASGRWLISVLQAIEIKIMGSHINAKGFVGAVTFLFIAVICNIIAKKLNIQKFCSLLLLSAVAVTFPFVSSLMGYSYTAVYYYISILLALWAAVMVRDALPLYKNWWRLLLGAVLLGLSMSIYQVSLCVFAAFLIVLAIRDSLQEENESWKRFLGRCSVCLVGTGVGCAGYLIVNKIVLYLLNAQMTDYKNINSMGEIPLELLLKRCVLAYKEFFFPSSNVSYSLFRSTVALWCYRFLMLGLITAVVIIIIEACRKRQFRKAVHLALLFAIMPLAIKSIFLATEQKWIYELMLFPELMFFALILVMGEHLCTKFAGMMSLKRYFSGAMAVLLVYLCVHFAYVANVGYTKAAISQESTISYFTRLSSRIQSLEGYSTEYPVAYINEFSKNSEQLTLPEMNDVVAYKPFQQDSKDIINNYNWKEYMDQWCGFGPVAASHEQMVKLLESEEVAQMPCYPDAESIAIIDGVVVVKFD